MPQALLWVTNKSTGYLGQKFRDDHRPRTRPNSSQACSTSPRMIILSLLLLVVLGHSFTLRLVLGLALSYAVCTYGARYWAWPHPMQFECRAQLAPTIAPQNLAFRLLGRKGGFWFSLRISLMIWFCWVKSQQHVFIFLWLIPDSSVLRVRPHLILATPLSPTLNGWMIIQRWLSFLGIWAGEFPLLIFVPL